MMMSKRYHNELGDVSNIPDATIPGLDDTKTQRDKQWVKVMFRALKKQETREKIRGPMALCFYLCSYVCRDENYNKALNIYNNYYTKGYLAASIKMDKLAREFGYVDRNSINSQINTLLELKYLRKEKARTPAGRYQNVYIMGKVVNGKSDWYFNRV